MVVSLERILFYITTSCCTETGILGIWERFQFFAERLLSLLQKLIMKYIGRAERARFMSKRVVFSTF